MENVECGICGVWKMRSVENAEWNVNKLIKKRDASLHFLDAQFVLYTNAPVYTNVLTCDQAPLMSLRTTRTWVGVWYAGTLVAHI